MKTKLKLVALALIALTMASCTYDANFRSYVMAHRATYNATRPELEHYIESDTTLNAADKLSYKGRLEAEDLMITTAETLLGIKR